MYVCVYVCVLTIQQRTISIRASRMHDGYGMVLSMYCMAISPFPHSRQTDQRKDQRMKARPAEKESNSRINQSRSHKARIISAHRRALGWPAVHEIVMVVVRNDLCNNLELDRSRLRGPRRHLCACAPASASQASRKHGDQNRRTGKFMGPPALCWRKRCGSMSLYGVVASPVAPRTPRDLRVFRLEDGLSVCRSTDAAGRDSRRQERVRIHWKKHKYGSDHSSARR